MSIETSDQDTTSECLEKLTSTLQEVHAKEKHEMEDICEEKLQLSECLDRMSTELMNLNRSINKGSEKGNPNHDVEDGVALANMLDEIERGHRRAEELETKIENMQKKLDKENAINLNNTAEMQKAWRELQKNRLQLSKKTNEIECYTKALRGETDKLQAESNESDEDLLNTLDIAGKMRKRLQKCDEEFACHESSYLSKELEKELDEVQRQLEATDTSNITAALDSRDAHIKELEERLFAKEKEIQETQQKLQELEQAIGDNESRARQLESDLKVLDITQWRVSSSS